MNWIVVVLLIAVALGQFADFLLGPKGQQRIKDRVLSFYVRYAEGAWLFLIRQSAEATDSFLSKFFGPAILSPRAQILSLASGLLTGALAVFLSLWADLLS
jgi:hypothetical protein